MHSMNCTKHNTGRNWWLCWTVNVDSTCIMYKTQKRKKIN